MEGSKQYIIYIHKTKAGSLAFFGVNFSTILAKTSVNQIKLLVSQQHLMDYIPLMTFFYIVINTLIQNNKHTIYLSSFTY